MWLKNCALFLLVCVVYANAAKFKVSREWKFINFTWPSAAVYKTAIDTGIYVPENNIIAGIKHFEDNFYMTLPRMKNGVPATLAMIPAAPTDDTSPLLKPFPSWEMNQVGDCNALQNVQNIEIDPKGQVWIIDGGRTETLGTNPMARCPPKLVIFDIKMNTTTTTYMFPDHVASFNSNFLYDIVVDNTDAGYAYITDNSGKDPGIIVFSVKDHKSWKIRHAQTMRADPTATSFRVNGVMISAPINIASIALGPKIHTSNDRIIVNEDREVYFSPLSSLHLFSVNTSVLRNEMNAMNDGEYQGEIKDYGLKSSQSVGMIMDNQGILYFSLLATNSIARWDSHTSFQSGQKIIARDENFLEWPNSFTFDQNGNISVLVNKLNKFIYEKINVDEVNFRLITANVGGKSYLYDQNYEYLPENTSQSSTSTTSEKLPEPHLPPGIDQDPYLVPNPLPAQSSSAIPERSTSPEPEPTAEPEPTQNHMDHDHMNHDHMDHDHMNNDHMSHDHMEHDMKQNSSSTNMETARKLEEQKPSGTNGLVATFIGVLFAGILFIF